QHFRPRRTAVMCAMLLWRRCVRTRLDPFSFGKDCYVRMRAYRREASVWRCARCRVEVGSEGAHDLALSNAKEVEHAVRLSLQRASVGSVVCGGDLELLLERLVGRLQLLLVCEKRLQLLALTGGRRW